jgi:hypothetical protein
MKEPARSVVAFPVVALLTACAGSPKSKAALEQMSVEQLIREMVSPSAAQPSYWGYDETYTGRIRAEWVRRFPAWPEAVKQAVLAGHIRQGMTFDQVVCSWGPAHHSSSHTSGNSSVQTLIYNRGGSVWQSVTLTNGAVTGWSDHN